MTTKYLEYFPKPFLEDLAMDQCIPFVGAGFSKNANFPSGKTSPDWDQLGKSFADLIPGYQYNGALDAISAYAHEYSRPKLIEKLTELLLINEGRAGETHKSFSELPFGLVCTTNFDFLLEKGYDLVARPCRPIIEEDQLSISNSGYRVSLLKFHGDLHHPNRLVATEEDYDGFIDNNPMLATFLANILITKTAFFVGYSLDDADFRQIWQLIKNRLGKLRRQAYALSVDCTSHEIARYERRGIKVINLPGSKNDYPTILTNVFKELKDFWSKEIFKFSTVTNEDRLIELSLPQEKNSRLCFFSIPFRLLSFYKKYVFPIVQDFGFVPITADEVLSSGENIMAKISALIDRAGIVVADISSPFVIHELGIALVEGKNLLLIREKGSPIPPEFHNFDFFERESDPFASLDELLLFFSNYFEKMSIDNKSQFDNEAIRLFEKKEYRAAVISAIIILENVLRKYLRDFSNDFNVNLRSLREMIHLAERKEIINEKERNFLLEYNQIRNRLVHTDTAITRNEAKKGIDTITKIINKITHSS